MKRILFLLLISFSFAFSSSAQVLCIKCYNQNAGVLTDTNNLIVNGGFENKTGTGLFFCPNSNGYNCDISNWTCTGGGAGTYAFMCDPTFSIIVEGTKAVYFGNSYAKACSVADSDTSCISNNGCEVTGIPVGYPVNGVLYGGITGVSLQQTVNGLTPGSIYILEFWAGGEWTISNYHNEGLFAVNAGFGNIFLRDPPTEPNTGIGRRYVIVFGATSSSHTIKFTNWGHICDSCTELVLDDVRLFKAGPDDTPCAVSSDDLTKNAVTVFPNPVTDRFTITTNTNAPTEVTIYDVASRKLLQQKFTGTVSLNIENLARGIYLYEIRDEHGWLKQGKLVKE